MLAARHYLMRYALALRGEGFVARGVISPIERRLFRPRDLSIPTLHFL